MEEYCSLKDGYRGGSSPPGSYSSFLIQNGTSANFTSCIIEGFRNLKGGLTNESLDQKVFRLDGHWFHGKLPEDRYVLS